MSPIIWHKVRSVVMTMAMKTISIAIDKVDSIDLPNVYSYMGYTFCGATCLFGPWISFKDYVSLRCVYQVNLFFLKDRSWFFLNL